MANYYGTARTNYFRVKDEAVFKAWAAKRCCEVAQGPPSQLYALLPDAGCEGTFRSYDPDTEEDFDLLEEIATHLADDSVCVMMESGHENMRYIIGWACAINSKGEREFLSIDNIYKAAERLGTDITRCEY